MKRQLTLPEFVRLELTASRSGQKLTVGEVTVLTGGCVNDLGLELDSGQRYLGHYSDETIQ